MKKYKTNIIILILISVLIMYLIMKDDFNNIIDAIKNVDVKFLLIALILMILYIFFQSMSLHLYLKSINQCFTSIKRLTSDFFLICISKFIQCVGAAAIKTMGADLALWQTYGCYKLLDGIELQCG